MCTSGEDEVEVTVLASMGIVRSSSRDCCDEGTISSSGEGVEEGVAESGVEVSVSFSVGPVGLYPDSPSDCTTSSVPSIESHRIWLAFVVLTLSRSL
jgi:hypothetical protein